MAIGGDMRFCLDTDVFIQAHRSYYAFDIVPGFWDALIEWAKIGLICSPIPIYDELVPKVSPYDSLALWSKNNKALLFSDVDEDTVKSYSEIANTAVQLYEPQHYQLFLDVADSWVVAYAHAKNLAVVTMESKKNEETNPSGGKVRGRIKIPNICEHLDVRCINTYSFLRELGGKFKW
jgi:hypothetical protein